MNRQDRYITNLCKMISKKTISEIDQNDLTAFFEFHELLKEIFPNITNICKWEKYNASILLKWSGKSNKNPVLFMNHHDTVEPLDGWTYPPFGAEIHDGKLYGRGTLDTKSGLWAMLQAADDLAAEGFIPEHDIYFMSTCNEETTNLGAAHFSEEFKKNGITFSMVLDEGGFIMYEPISGAKNNFAMIGIGEKGYADLLFTAKGMGGHSSAPESNTPLVRLAKFISKVESSNIFRVELSECIKEMFKRMAPYISGPLSFVFAHPDLFSLVLKNVMPKTSGTAKALLQSTLAFTMAKGSNCRNVIPNEATVVGNLRVSHHQGFKECLDIIKKLAEKYDIEVSILEPAVESPLSDFNSKAFHILENALKITYPESISCPYIMTGCSDARYMGNLTQNCFHFLPFFIDEQQLNSIHGIDENVFVSNLIPAVDFYQYLMREASYE